jgi:stage III sporulation protein AG
LKTKNIGKEKIALLALAGILLVAASYFESGMETGKEQETTAEVTNLEEDYQTQSERKVKRLVESINGISDVKVMITLKSGNEKVLQEDSEVSSSEKKGTDDTENSSSVKKTTVIFNQDGDENPYVIKENYPEIEGIAVTAKGISDNKEEIIHMLAALFDVPVHKISVLESD